jgi:hypothetical protein
VAPTTAWLPSGRRGVSSPRRADVSEVGDDEEGMGGAVRRTQEHGPLPRMLAIPTAHSAVAVTLRSSEHPRPSSPPVQDGSSEWCAAGTRRQEKSTPLSGMAPPEGGGLSDSSVSEVCGDARLP